MIKKFEEFNEGFFDETKIKLLCRKYGIKDYTINKDGSVDVNGDVILAMGKRKRKRNTTYVKKRIDSIPIKFGRVDGYFYCEGNNLTNLVGSPRYVGGSFYCSHNKLSSLKGCPEYVGGSFYIENNEIRNLDIHPKEIGGSFYYKFNPISYVLDQFGYMSRG